MKDCIIIGAGPAGLTAALYLKRFQRAIQIIDAGASRATLIPLSHNFPGVPQGISGNEILLRMRQHLEQYNEKIMHDKVVHLEQQGKNFRVLTQHNEFFCKKVLLATGVMDIEPALPNLENAIRRGLIRHCPICDGYEVINQKIGVIGFGTKGLKEALFLSTYSKDITLLTLGQKIQLKEHELGQLNHANIKIINDAIVSVKIVADKISALLIKSGEEIKFDTLYSALGAQVRNELALAIGAKCSADKCLVVDAQQQTSITGLYAAGDIVSGLNQISVAIGQAAIAATAIHNSLREEL